MSEMTKEKWRQFRRGFIAVILLATWLLYEQDVFVDANFVVLGIVAVSYAAIGVAWYFFWKDQPDDLC